MDRIQVVAVILALVAFGLYYATLPAARTRPEGEVPPESSSVAVSEQSASSSTAPIANDAMDPGVMTQGLLVELRNDAVRMAVSTTGGRVEEVELIGFSDRKGSGAAPVELVTHADHGTLSILLGDESLVPLERAQWEIRGQSARSVELRASVSDVEVSERIELDAEGYGARMRLSIRNRGSATVRPRPQLQLYAQDRPPGAPDRFLNYSLVWEKDGSVTREMIEALGSPGFFGRFFGASGSSERVIPAPVELAGVDSQYFLLAAASDNPRETQALVRPLGPNLGQILLQYGEMELPPGTSVERTWRLYLGPKIPERVHSVDPRFEILTDVGWHWVRPLVNLFAAGLKWLHDRAVGNYGWAIIIITLLLRIATYPLTQRSMKSMKKFSAIAPEMKALQDQYGKDRGKLQEEMMKLYRVKGINPLSSLGGGCIPMLIQMPFMVALYFALQSSIELRHAPFLGWIDDLSAPEDLRLFGLPVRLLPLLMGASMVLQQRLTPSPTADPQQRQMMSMMSIMFVVLFYGFPSGLVLYWLVSNLLGIAQQLWVNRAPSPAG